MPKMIKRTTFSITPDMEICLDKLKKDVFYNCSQAEMIRSLVNAGLAAYEKTAVTDNTCNFAAQKDINDL